MQDLYDDNATPAGSEPIEFADDDAELQTLVLDRPGVADFLACRRRGGR